MGCFSTCFGKSKRQRRCRTRPIKASPSLLDHLQKCESVEDFKVPQLIEEEEKIENPIDPSSESKDEKREKGNVSERKKVTFDLNVKIYEPEEEEEEEEALVNGDSEEINGGGERKAESKKKEETASDSNSSSSSLFSYPLNHRYQDCRDSDEDFDEILSSDESEIDYYTDDDDEDDDYDDEEEEVESEANHEKKPEMGTQDQSSESLFSLSLESSRKQNSGAETGDNKEVNSPMPNKNPNPNDNPRFDRSKYVNSVLNPVENVAQWKVVMAKSKRVASKEEDWESKENLDRTQDSSGLKEKEEREIGVDTSLSSWLKVGSEATPNSKTSSVSVGNSGSLTNNTLSLSPKKFEDRPILGALTLEEIRQFSASSSPRKSPGFSPDDKPIIGSVGSYWSHTGQSTKSGSSTKNRTRFAVNAKVIWDPTPFETRLEKALEEAGLTDEQGLRV